MLGPARRPLRAAPVVLLAVVALAGCQKAPSGPAAPPIDRERTLLREGWRFVTSNGLSGAEAVAYDDTKWQRVRLPHTWAKDDPRTYKAAWYRTHFAVAKEDAGKRIYLAFEGAAAIADVYVNGVHLGQHRGAYTRFLFDATDHVTTGDNVLAVKLDNDPADTADCLPSGLGRQLYHVYGGLYRKVWLLKTNALHIDPTDHAASGVFVTATNVTSQSAGLSIRTLVRNAAAARTALEVRSSLRDAGGREVGRWTGRVEVEPGARGEVVLAGALEKPHLWSPADPYLYELRTELSADGTVVDAVTERTGFRDFRFVKPGFRLNGEPILLRGTNKHQETEAHFTAVEDAELREDFANLKDLGVNVVRLAHYPHAELEYALADELGLLVIAENGHSSESKSEETGDSITREMVRQNYNHPSIVVWSVGNEAGFVRVDRYARIVRSEDPVRLITYASNAGGRPNKRDLTFIAQNTYRGWYMGQPWDFEEKALRMRYVMESGGGAVVTTHTDYAAARREVDRFEPEEYRQLLAEIHFQVVFRDHKDEIPLYLVWVFRDFRTEKYKGRWNTKGLLTAAGHKKDPYYLYKSFLRPDEPVVHITSKTYFLRRGSVSNGVKVYSNRPGLTLTVNGEDQGRKANGEYRHKNRRVVENVFYWPCRLRRGRNEVSVTDGAGHSDSALIDFHGADGAPPAPHGGELVQGLRSSNPANPAYFIDQPARPQWPFYYDLDGSADNSFDRLPDVLAGARWISTRRLSRTHDRSDLSFTIRSDAGPVDVFVLFSDVRDFTALGRAGFADTGITGLWRSDDLELVGYRLYRKACRGGDRVSLPGEVRDYVVLIKPGASAPASGSRGAEGQTPQP